MNANETNSWAYPQAEREDNVSKFQVGDPVVWRLKQGVRITVVAGPLKTSRDFSHFYVIDVDGMLEIARAEHLAFAPITWTPRQVAYLQGLATESEIAFGATQTSTAVSNRYNWLLGKLHALRPTP